VSPRSNPIKFNPIKALVAVIAAFVTAIILVGPPTSSANFFGAITQ